MGKPGSNAFLLSHAKAPLREEKRDAVSERRTARTNSNPIISKFKKNLK
jgi:hypothetical protein